MTRRARKAWNGGTRETAMAAARQRTEEAIASGCPRCRNCGGDGGLSAGRICECCGGAGFFVPEGGMPLPRSVDCTMTDPAELARGVKPPEGTEPRGVRARQPIRRQVLFDMWAAHLSTKASHALADLYIESAGEAAERIDDICQLRGVGERTRAELVEFVGRAVAT